MKNWMHIIAIGILAAFIMVSCSKKKDDPDTCAAGWENSFLDEYEAFVEAAQTYSNSGTKEDCEKYKAALLDYIDAIRVLEDCYILIGQEASWRASLDEAEMEAQMIQC